jgi:peptide/nickel transport system ATP-binding protein
MSDASAPPLLAVEELSVKFHTRSGTVHAIDRASFVLHARETLALVGESGSGKSVTAYAIMGILGPAAAPPTGRVVFNGIDLLRQTESSLAQMRGRELSMIFQNPRTGLNPIRGIGRQIADVLRRHAGLTPAEARKRAAVALAQVKIADSERRARAYPFELSGGMCQRVMIAMALCCKPALLIADEPTTGLDVTTQAVIMGLIADLAKAEGMATLLITHDIALAAERAQRIAVMHAGHVVEVAASEEILTRPRHPYTKRLIAATPSVAEKLSDLNSIPGGLPDLRRSDLPPCRYSRRCELYQADCDRPMPPLRTNTTHAVFCHHPL